MSQIQKALKVLSPVPERRRLFKMFLVFFIVSSTNNKQMKLSLLTAKQNILRQEQESNKRLTKKRRDFNALLLSAGAGKRKRDMSGQFKDVGKKRPKNMGEDVVKTFVDKLIAEIQTHERNKDEHHSVVVPVNANEIRKAYVKAIKYPQHITAALRARLPTVLVADRPVTLQYEIIYGTTRGEASKLDDGKLEIHGDPKLRSSIIHDLASIGRSSPNIHLLSNFASRIQCFLIPYKSGDNMRLAVVDFFSANGTDVEQNGEVTTSKKPNGETIIRDVDPSQPFIIRIGADKIVIRFQKTLDKDCIVCLNNIRTQVYRPCNHFVCCDVCTNKLEPRDCPYCRQHIERTETRDITKNNLNTFQM